VTAQPGETGNINVYVEGSSSGVIDKDVVTEIEFNFWINGQLEYNKNLSYAL